MSHTPTPKVSVIMAVYNGERYLREAVESILNQTFTDFEFIIVDDGSTDGTAAILNTFGDSRIVRLRNHHNVGLTPSLNRGLEVARGRYIARQDADDVSYPARLERQVAFLDSRPEVGLLGTAYDVIDELGRLVGQLALPTEDCDLQRMLVRHNCFGHGSVMMRRSVLDCVGEYDETICITQDYDLWLRLAEVTRLANVPTPLYAWRRHAESLSAPSRGELASHDRAEALRWMLARRACDPDRPGYAPRDLAAAHVVLAVGGALQGKWETARTALVGAWLLAGDWLDAGGFAEVVAEALWTESSWAGWSVIVALFERLLANLPTGAQPRRIREAQASLYRHQAFEAYTRGQAHLVRKTVWNYWRCRPLSLVTDRGMASIWLRSWRRHAHA